MKPSFLIFKNLRRRPLRTALTVLGVGCAMMLLVVVESLNAGLERALSAGEAARTLIVYRQNRYCPQTSLLPERFTEQVARIAGVESVLPVKIYLNNCRASLDLVTFHGAPVEKLLASRHVELLEGDLGRFQRERDSALVGRAFAARKGLAVGDAFRFGNVQVKVVGIFSSRDAIEEGVILTHLEYLQRSGPVNRLGTVTQLEVKVRDAAQAEAIASQIDDLFRTSEAPTDTRPQVLFLESATRDLREILRFARWLALGCVVVVLALVGNAVWMSVQERVREMGVFRTLGFKSPFLFLVVLGESVLLALVGGALGAGAALLLITFARPTLSSEGVPVELALSVETMALGIAIAAASGAAAGLLPAIRCSRAEIVDSLRYAS